MTTPCWPSPSAHHGLECLPSAFIIGFPKCATSDLWERLKRHPEVLTSSSKETRFLTQGEFSSVSPKEGWLGRHTALRAWTIQFDGVAGHLVSLMNNSETRAAANRMVTVEATPLTAWWSSQRPDQGLGLAGPDVFPPRLLQHLVPKAKLIAVVGEPGNRMYSDYFFLSSTGVTESSTEAAAKNPSHFHDLVESQATLFTQCLRKHIAELSQQPP
eukprot:CAMPEP_0118983220 /NCGR_PEP_ID=MMETSP1173-20130426/34802_1 /TAXON_ID=1034831 /ORGANISM="Rhizochromulina marina cf, Strain CCMP1243" /LENGTH=214 /DNA_ID=CAMNT_0006933775 /DNA_START=20 /DNA_END=661 /DNA_ORIENTATION=-